MHHSSSTEKVDVENGREKRVRKQRLFDNDFVSYNPNKDKGKLGSIKSELTILPGIELNNINSNDLTMQQNAPKSSGSTNSIAVSNNNNNNEIKYNIGDLVWAKVSGHPWWPCVISCDKNEGNTHVKAVGGTRPKRMFYVDFFGPTVEHAWVTEGCLIEYKGIEAFKTYAQDQVDQAPTKSQKEKLAERFQLKVALTRRDHWEHAVEEADELLKNKRPNENYVDFDSDEENLTPPSKQLSKIRKESISKQEQDNNKNNKNGTKTPDNKVSKRKRLSSLANSEDKSDINNLVLTKIKKSNDKNKIKQEVNTEDSKLDLSASTSEIFESIEQQNNSGNEDNSLSKSPSRSSSLSSSRSYSSLHENSISLENENFIPDTNDLELLNNLKNEILAKNELLVDQNNSSIENTEIKTQRIVNRQFDIDRKPYNINDASSKNNKDESFNEIRENFLDKNDEFNYQDIVNMINIDELVSSEETNVQKKRGRKPKPKKPNSHQQLTTTTIVRGSKRFVSVKKSQTGEASMANDLIDETVYGENCQDECYLRTSRTDLFIDNNEQNILTPQSKEMATYKIKIRKTPASETLKTKKFELSLVNDEIDKNINFGFNKITDYSEDEEEVDDDENEEEDEEEDTSDVNFSDVEKINPKKQKQKNKNKKTDESFNENYLNSFNFIDDPSMKNCDSSHSKQSNAETYLIDRYKYAVRHIKQGLSVEEACNKYRISKGALLKCLSGGTAPRGKKTRLTENEENTIVEWLISNQNLKYNEAIHLVFQEVVNIFQKANRPNPFHNGKPSMDWWYDFLSRHPQIMASKPDWLMRGKVNDQYIKDVQSGKLKCTKFRRALLSAIQYIRSLNDNGSTNSNCENNNNRIKLTNDNKNTGDNKKISLNTSTASSAGTRMEKPNINKQSSELNRRNYVNKFNNTGGAARLNVITYNNNNTNTNSDFNSQNLKGMSSSLENLISSNDTLVSTSNSLKSSLPITTCVNNNNNNINSRMAGSTTGSYLTNLTASLSPTSVGVSDVILKNNNGITANTTLQDSPTNINSMIDNVVSSSVPDESFDEGDNNSNNNDNIDTVSYKNLNVFNNCNFASSRGNLLNEMINDNSINQNENLTTQKHLDLSTKRLVLRVKLGQQQQHLLVPDDDDDDDLKETIDPSAFCHEITH